MQDLPTDRSCKTCRGFTTRRYSSEKITGKKLVRQRCPSCRTILERLTIFDVFDSSVTYTITFEEGVRVAGEYIIKVIEIYAIDGRGRLWRMNFCEVWAVRLLKRRREPPQGNVVRLLGHTGSGAYRKLSEIRQNFKDYPGRVG